MVLSGPTHQGMSAIPDNVTDPWLSQKALLSRGYNTFRLLGEAQERICNPL